MCVIQTHKPNSQLLSHLPASNVMPTVSLSAEVQTNPAATTLCLGLSHLANPKLIVSQIHHLTGQAQAVGSTAVSLTTGGVHLLALSATDQGQAFFGKVGAGGGIHLLAWLWWCFYCSVT